MKKLQHLVLLFAFVLMGYSSGLHAEDTDLYVANAANRGTPNVLIVIDNGADFSANASIGCGGYLDGTGAPSTGTSNTSGVLQCALVNTIQSLQDSAVNIGIMVSNANGFATTQATTNPASGGYHELCAGGGLGGCLLRKLTTMDATGKSSLINFIKGWGITGQSNANSFNIKVNSSYQAETMQEAWAYFSGKTGMSGTTYSPSVLLNGCQSNVIVYISNTQKNPNSSESNDAKAALAAPQVGATADQLAGITGVINFTPPICGGSGTSSIYTLQTGNNWADEWARLMNQINAGARNVLTYTIGIESSTSQCSADTFGLIASMANVGGGEFFRVSSVSDLSSALAKILNQTQAANSVFSSASLPVSVNADGSYLNQIYLGMFRPDATAGPRWFGNLKQYHLVKNSAGALVQGDANNQPAINPTTGFISPTSLSFWTSKNTSSVPDSMGGFWKNAPASQGTLQSPYDYVDGEVVEKGGVSQQVRLESVTANFSTTAQTSTNPRRMYVYCPDGSATCPKDLTAATNQFSTSNSAIPSNAFGSDSIVPINSIIRSGTTALVSTSGNHGFKSGTVVTISGAAQPEYNVTQTLTTSTVNSSTTFTLTGLPDYPASPSQGTYTIGPAVSGTTVNIVSMSRATHTTGGYNTESVTVNTDVAGGFTTTSNVTITGASPSVYNYSGMPTSASGTALTFDVAVTPATPAANAYVMQLAPTTYPARSVTLTNPVAGEIDGDTSPVTHGLHAGQKVVITGANTNSKYAGTYTIASVASNTFKITTAGASVKNLSSESGTVRPDTTAQGIVTLTRDASTDVAYATATGLPANWFGAAANDTAVINVSKTSGSATNESAYVASGVTATCANAGCTTLTYPISASPSSTVTLNSAKVGPQSVTTAVLPAGRITRSGTTVTVNGPFLDSNGAPVIFSNGQTLAIAASGTALASEQGYLGTWTISCSSCTTSFTLLRPDGSTVALTPATPATGVGMTAYAAGTPPDRDTLIRWIRGEDNFGGEKGPGSPVTVRASVHGDVLHSRPVVINYGGSLGIVVFYGSNDGVYRAVNGNQTTGNINGVPPGGELWGLVLPEHFTQYNRLRQDSPELKFPTTTLVSARPKDYFVDGQTAAYQLTNADGTINKAYLYITMRRGGRLMYALDVTNPLVPTVMWKISSADAGFGELGQTWSRPRVTLVQGGTQTTPPSPVLIFGAGYDPAEDSQAPRTDTMGRGIYVVNALTGALIWSASSSCGTSTATCLNVPGMQWAVPSDMAFVDRDGNGFTDKIYFGDMGGNLWRADVAAASTSSWTVTKIGALGCDEGAPSTSTHLCVNGTAPRKFFFPPAVLAVKAAGATGSFDAISIPSGDREHPLKEDTNPASAYFVTNRFFMINDLGTQVITDPATQTGALPTQNVTQASLFNATSAPYDATASAQKPTGFYITFATSEKGVNAPLATSGQVFFATNQPTTVDASCSANLGLAKAYAVSPFLGTATSNLIIGGGLPPSPVAGLINITTTNPTTGVSTTSQEKFCIGCAAQCTTCSALENSPPPNIISKNVKRTYWYKK